MNPIIGVRHAGVILKCGGSRWESSPQRRTWWIAPGRTAALRLITRPPSHTVQDHRLAGLLAFFAPDQAICRKTRAQRQSGEAVAHLDQIRSAWARLRRRAGRMRD